MKTLALLLTLVATTPAFAAPELTLERLVADPPLAGRPPTALTPSPGGRWLAFTQGSASDSEVHDLWAMPLTGGAPVLLVRASDLAPGAETLTEAERMERERKRISQRGITSFGWCGGDTALLVPYSGDLYHVALVGPGGELGAPKVTRLTQDEAPELDPRCDPTGRHVAFVRGQDLWVTDVTGATPRALTKASLPTTSFGVAEFIAAEEMGRHEGYGWSGDGERLVVFEVDESPVAEKLRSKIFADRTELFAQRYPVAGAANAVVRLHVIERASGQATPVALPTEDGYVARAELAADGALLVQWQSRDQKRLVLFEASAPSWKPRRIFEEKDAAWVELTDDLRVLDGERLLWTSERTGSRQLYVVQRKSGKASPLAKLAEPVRAVVGLDPIAKVVFVEAGVGQGMEQHVFRVPLDGKPATRITTEPGTHRATFVPTGTAFIDSHSRFGEPPRVTLRKADGTVVTALGDGVRPITEVARPTPIKVAVKAEDGTPLNAMVLPPIERKAGQRYPVVTYVYGGPTGQVVGDHWMRLYPFLVWLTHNGYGVFMVDNRGAGGRDRAFSRAILRRFGDIEVVDVFAGVAALKAQEAWVDPQKIGIFGWSYGGYLAARAVLDEATPFAAAAAIAPVTDWRLYDTHYTERYLGKPSDPGDPYTKSSLIPRAPLLKQPLALIHGMADDNVLFEHTLLLVEALQAQSIGFELMAYPGRAHGLAGRSTQLHLYRTLAAFFDRHLR